jgi:outer membrane protein OmpA-like peptidoglycan-associated protein
MKENKKENFFSPVIIILIVIASLTIIAIFGTCIALSSNINKMPSDDTEQKKSKEDETVLTDTQSENSSSEDFYNLMPELPEIVQTEPLKFIPPSISKEIFDPFKNITNLDVFARNNKDSHLGIVHFEYGKTEVNSEELSGIISLLTDEQIQNLYFIIEGHTDSKSSWSFNKTLSENRAKAVSTFLQENYSVPAEHIKTAGYSWDRLLVKPEKTAEDYAKNRRVEISCFTYD